MNLNLVDHFETVAKAHAKKVQEALHKREVYVREQAYVQKKVMKLEQEILVLLTRQEDYYQAIYKAKESLI